MAAVAGQVHERLGHEGRAHPVLFRDRPRHVFEEHVPVGSQQAIVIVPVHLELAIGVLVVVLVRLPAQGEHGIADLGDHVVAPHQRLLVVAGFLLGVGGIGQGLAVGRDQEELALHAALHALAVLGGAGDHLLQLRARAVGDFLAVHPQVAGEPTHFRLPRQLDQAVGIGLGEQVGVRRCHVEPGGEAGETGAVALHVADRRGRRQLGAQHAEQVGVADQEILDLSLFGDFGQIGGHGEPPLGRRFSDPLSARTRRYIPFLPGIQLVPASGTPAMAAASTVSATRSSGSRLCTWLLPQARAMICVSIVSTAR